MPYHLLLISFFLSFGLTAAAVADTSLKQLVQENRIADAIPQCRHVESLQGVDNEQRMLCAWVFFRAGKAESGDRLLAMLQKGGSSPQIRLLNAFAKMQKKDYIGARAILAPMADEFKTGSIGAQVQETSAELYELQDQKDTAAFLYRQVAAEDPTRGRAAWGLARYHLSKNEIPKAKEFLEKTAKAWPKHVGSRYNLAVISLNENKFSESAKWLVESYKLDKGDPGILEQMGVLFEKRGKIKEATKFWQRALAIQKDSPLANEKLHQYAPEAINRLAQKKDFDGAIAQLDSTPESRIPQKEIRKAILLRKSGQLDKSTALLTTFLKRRPKEGMAYRELGINALNAKNAKLARTHFQRAIGLEPKNGSNYAWLGFTLEGTKSYAEAKEAWKKAIELLSDPQEIEKAQRRLAALEAKAKEKRKVARDREESGDEDHDIEKEIESIDIFDGVYGLPHQ